MAGRRVAILVHMLRMAAKDRYIRTIDEVSSVLHHAKVSEKDLKPLTQVVRFADQNNLEDNLQLLELDSNLLDFLSLGDRGDNDESAVICTNNRTYEVKAAEISNSLALVPDISWSCDAERSSDCRHLEEKQVLKVFYEYLEIRLCRPRLVKLRALLSKGQYAGPESESEIEDNTVKLYTIQDLLNCVQASEEELLIALKENFACCIDGYWRLLDSDYHFRVLSLVLGFFDENSWSLDKIIKEEVMEGLNDVVPELILNHLLDWYTVDNGKHSSNGKKLYCLRQDRICRFFGEILLRPAGNFNLEEFLCAWQQSVPEGMETDLKYLEGLALKDTASKPHVIYFFPEWELPEDISERFKLLFQTREKWTIDDIRPYIERLSSQKMNVNALLTKHARTSTSSGVKWFSSRHGK